MEQELDKKFLKLLSSRAIVESSKGPLWLTYPTLKQRQTSDYYRDKYLKEYKLKGVPTIEQTLKEHKDDGAWSDAKEDGLKKIPKFIEETLANIKVEKQPSALIKHRRWLRLLEQKYTEL